jgi:RNA polymerase sigma-70 factor, ECF subfamily
MPVVTVVGEVTRRQPLAAASDTAEQLFHEHSGWIYGYCLRIMRSPEEAEDALQTTYLNACRSLNEGTRPRAGSAWLLRIAKNVCFARLRATGRRGRLERTQDIAILEDTVAAPDRAEDDLIGLTDALLAMPEQQRTAILLREWQGLSYGEVGEELGLSQSAVETLIFRARRSLAAGLESPPKRRRLQSLHAFDLGGLVAALKGFVAGAGLKTVAALTVVAATTATVAATDPAHIWRDRSAPVKAPAQARVDAPRPAAAAQLLPIDRGFVSAPVERERPAATDRSGRVPGQATAAAAKAKPKSNNGNAHGRANAHGQTKKAEHAPAATELPGPPPPPPPQAEANGLEKPKNEKSAKAR